MTGSTAVSLKEEVKSVSISDSAVYVVSLTHEIKVGELNCQGEILSGILL